MDAALNPIKLTEADGYRVTNSGGDRPAPKPVEGHAGFVNLRDMIGNGGGRIQDWKLCEHIESSKERGWPMFKRNEFLSPKGAEVAICGGGPSLAYPENLRALRALQKRGVKIHAVNRTHDFLFTKGIRVDSAALLDPIPHVRNYIKPRKGVRYYIASQCHPETLDVFEGFDKRLWHARASGAEEMVLTKEELDGAVASRTSSVGLRSVVLKMMEGYRHIHMFGFDSSYDRDVMHAMFKKWALPNLLNADGSPKEGDNPEEVFNHKAWECIAAVVQAIKLGMEDISLHAYLKPETIHDVRPFKLAAPDGQSEMFYSNSAMAAQADEFQVLIKDISMGIRAGALEQVFMYVHGSGMLPCIAGWYGLHAKKGFNVCHKATDTASSPRISTIKGTSAPRRRGRGMS